MDPKILVGVITHSGDKYCREEFFKQLGRLTYPVDKFFFVTNSGQDDAEDIRSHFSLLTDAEVKVTKEKEGIGRHVYAMNRNAVRDFFLDGNWTHLVFIDSDVFPPRNMIEVMLGNNKPLLSGVYLGGVKDIYNVQRLLPVFWGINKKGETVRADLVDMLIPRTIKAESAGLGCCLIRRDVLEKVEFVPLYKTNKGEDKKFFEDAKKEGYQLWVDTRILCPHPQYPIGDERNKYYNPRNYKLKKEYEYLSKPNSLRS